MSVFFDSADHSRGDGEDAHTRDHDVLPDFVEIQPSSKGAVVVVVIVAQ